MVLVRGTTQLRLRVEDDGSGFAPSARPPDASPEAAAEASLSAPIRPTDARGMGLRIMHYRARLAGGALDIRPGAEGGTVVTCTVPLRGPGFHSYASPS